MCGEVIIDFSTCAVPLEHYWNYCNEKGHLDYTFGLFFKHDHEIEYKQILKISLSQAEQEYDMVHAATILNQYTNKKMIDFFSENAKK